MNILLDTIDESTFQILKNRSHVFRFQRNPVMLFHDTGDITDFEEYNLVIDAEFYVLNSTFPNFLWSLHKVDSQKKTLIIDKINWKTESKKLR